MARERPGLPFQLSIMRPLAQRHGILFDVEPILGQAVRLVYPDGTVRYLRSSLVDLNHATSAAVARNRAYVLGFLRAEGLPVPEFRDFRRERREGDEDAEEASSTAVTAVREIADSLGYPLVIRMVERTGHGVLLAQSSQEVEAIASGQVPLPRHLLLQRPVAGVPVTIVVLDREAVLAFMSPPAYVTVQVSRAAADFAVEVVRRAGLRYAAVDLMLDAPDRPSEAAWYLMDVEPDPDLMGYAERGERERKGVEALYDRILYLMGRRAGSPA